MLMVLNEAGIRLTGGKEHRVLDLDTMAIKVMSGVDIEIMLMSGVEFVNVDNSWNGTFVCGMLDKYSVLDIKGLDALFVCLNSHLCMYCSGMIYEIPVTTVADTCIDIHDDLKGFTISKVVSSFDYAVVNQAVKVRFDKMKDIIKFEQNGVSVECAGTPCSKMNAMRRWSLC